MVDEDLWTDHPSAQGDEPAQVETNEPSASEEDKPTEEALGRGPDGRSLRDRGERPNYKDSLRPSIYKCSLGEADPSRCSSFECQEAALSQEDGFTTTRGR